MDEIICGECGEIHSKCRGHKKKKNSPDGKLHPCGKSPMANGCCDMHGGKSPIGMASPNFKTGRYSKHLPAKLAANYHEALGDAELTSTRETISLVDALIQERQEKIYKGESREFWLELKSLYSLYVSELKDIRSLFGTTEEFPDIIGDFTFEEKEDEDLSRQTKLDRANRYLDQFGELLNRGKETWDVFEVLQPMIEQQRKLQESENKRNKDLNQMIPAEKVFAIIALLSDIINRNVSDRDIRIAIAGELAATINR